MDQFLSWLAYHALVAPPYFWMTVILGVATGLFIRSKIVGVLVYALGNTVLLAFATFAIWWHGGPFPPDLKTLYGWSIGAVVGLVWWVVGRILRWGILKIARIPRVRRRVLWIVRTPGVPRLFTACVITFVGLLLLILALPQVVSLP